MVFLLFLPLFLLFLLQKHWLHRNVHLPPGPRGLALVGTLHQIVSSSPPLYLWQLSQKYGAIMSLKLGLVPTIVISSAKLAKEVMQTQDKIFCSRPQLLGQRKLSYNGLDLAFAPYGTYWREMRKLCDGHLFNSRRVQSFRSIREEEVSRMMEKISESAATTNLSEEINCLSSTIICRVAFGKSYENESIERNGFKRLVSESQAMLGTFYASDNFPFIGGLIDRLTGLIARLEKNFTEMDMFLQLLIDDHLDQKRLKPEQEDIIDILLQIWRHGGSHIQITWDHIKGVLMNIFDAGSDTTTAAVIWAMTFLKKNPIVMKKAQEEVRNLCGNKGFVNEDDVQNLPYLKAVVKETLRLQPIVPLLIPRETMQSCKLDGHEIPAKSIVYINAWAIGRDPEAWKNPEEFNPDRFIGSSIDFKGKDFGLIPFGAGRRICPGMNMAIALVHIAFSNLLYKFDWELPEGMIREDLDFEMLPGIVMNKKNDLCLVAKDHVWQK
ncbi:p450 domain-containing protein [Cephalotus follicularis]|uniref:p450 domain-containing protein n=1 Tax=Cephalotus follicularis TaxID=3775 RepID=A0A1Q3BP09_CEPFO|nr:p450 domain-containing protein [Cephalotus follicularis]